jgi:hypothetical protein
MMEAAFHSVSAARKAKQDITAVAENVNVPPSFQRRQPKRCVDGDYTPCIQRQGACRLSLMTSSPSFFLAMCDLITSPL